jgi:hypothetical protein
MIEADDETDADVLVLLRGAPDCPPDVLALAEQAAAEKHGLLVAAHRRAEAAMWADVEGSSQSSATVLAARVPDPDSNLSNWSRTRASKAAQSVARLGESIIRAFDRGDRAGFEAGISRMIELARDGDDADISVAAFQWIAANDGGALDEALRQKIWREPQILIDVIKSVRQFVTDPSAPQVDREEARRVLARYGYDDESLRREE